MSPTEFLNRIKARRVMDQIVTLISRKMREDIRKASDAELLWTSLEVLRHCRFVVQPDKAVVPSLGRLMVEYNAHPLKIMIDEELCRRYNQKEAESPARSRRLPVFLQVPQPVELERDYH